MKKFLVLVASLALFALAGASTAVAAPGDDSNACPPNSPAQEGDPACGHQDDRGNRDEQTCPPNSGNPGGQPPCGKPGEEEDGGQPPACDSTTDSTGPISGAIEQIAAGIESGDPSGQDGGPLPGALRQINCAVVIPLEDALGLNAQALGV